MRRNQHAGIIVVVNGSMIMKGFLSILALLLLTFSLSGIVTSLKPEYRISSQSVHTVANQFSGKMLFTLLANENHNFFQVMPDGKPSTSFSGQMLKMSANISLDDPRSLLGRELPGFSIFDSEILVAGEGTNYTNLPFESSPPEGLLKEGKEAELQNVDKLEESENQDGKIPDVTTNGKKVVHIYHTHNRESFLPYLKGVTNPDLAQHSKINITRLGDRLQQDFLEKGIGSTVDKTDVMDRLNQKGLKYPKSYQESRSLVQSVMASNKNLEYFIDIHRDSSRKIHTTTKIKGKSYAKIAFVIGGKNPHFEKNRALAYKLHNAFQEKYPGLSRGIIQKSGSGDNSVYNQDLSGNAMLIEVGGVDNTFEEMYATIDVFTDVFSEFYWDAHEVSNTSGKSEAK
ncbi:stage II sporulation protein P [Peribacillus cavernae]|uniref:Stage II sporulation protein P n=1 Tax=Peribacillus cavernae TaxID=1674310 RepID=A0A433HWQ5_9BACI|nr:stage II sporulation protein P [Peribacillus cavernae]MDQ0218243.1 stage II sporulation protein P [Peribacillus cavernae]RUQ32624.1 stage II sporulation protein P [Peribacillus cavernae]